MSKVYIVTSGDYSDYSIDACFSTEVLAQKYMSNRAKGNPYDKGRLEEWDMDGPTEWRFTCTVYMKENGDSWGGDVNWEHIPVPFVELYRFPGVVPSIAMKCKVLTNNPRRAVKVANEKRAQIITQGLWVIPAGKMRECVA